MKYEEVDLTGFHDVTLGKIFGKKPISGQIMLHKLWKFLVKNNLIKEVENKK